MTQKREMPHELRRAILARYTSIHAFCRQHPELKRSTVYAVLSGRYPGKAEAQISLIQTTLTGETAVIPSFQPVTEQELADALRNIRCNHCRRLDRRNCMECRAQTEREARELHGSLFYREVKRVQVTD